MAAPSQPAVAAAAAAKQAGNAAFAAGDYAAAERAYSEALAACDLQLNPTGMHVLYSNRAAARLKLSDWAGALADAEAALAGNPSWAKALYRKAAALRALGKGPAALAAAQQAAALEPGNAELQRLLRKLQQEASNAAAAAPACAGRGPPLPSATTGSNTSSRGGAIGGGLSATRRPPVTAALLPPLLAGAPFEYIPPPEGEGWPASNLLILLHGLGDRPTPFGRLARRMALPQTAALALGGGQEVPFSDGGRSWFTAFDEQLELIEGRPGEQRRLQSLACTVQALLGLLGALQAQCGWERRQVHLLGFSQGGSVALELARHCCGEQRLGSCVAISAGLLPEQLPELLRAAASPPPAAAGKKGVAAGGGTPVLLTHGSMDSVVSRRSVEESAAALRSMHSMGVELVSIPDKGHGMPQGREEMQQLMAFWAKHLGRRPTAADLPPGVDGEGDLLEIRPGEVSVQMVQQ